MINKIINEINAVCKMSINYKQIDIPFEELKISSISFIKIIVSLENTLNKSIPDEDLIYSKLNTIRKISEILSKV